MEWSELEDRGIKPYYKDEANILFFIEPQTDKISESLENWQGRDIRFFLGR